MAECVMMVADALELIARQRTQLNVTVHTAGWTYQQRLRHMASMLLAVADRCEVPSMAQVSAVQAHGLELMLIVDRDEMADPASGKEAA